MTESTVWWIVAGLLVATEMASGTFYLLMLAIGAAAGALAAHTGIGLSGQLIASAIVGVAVVLATYLFKRPRPGDLPARADRSVNLDIGETVQVDRWNTDGTAQVRYRGAQWTVRYKTPVPPRTGPHRVVELEGIHLLVEPVAHERRSGLS
ncbi:MAG: NfeD family protein [Burkholderiaceae bacterium]|jgi:membrane protein implicated in regulation of membrane protease activity|nr:NfeD family protein [Burkholderiaceae bacterium]